MSSIEIMRSREIARRADDDLEQAIKLRDAARAFMAVIQAIDIRATRFPFKGWDLKNMEETVREWTEFDADEFAKRVEQDLREALP